MHLGKLVNGRPKLLRHVHTYREHARFTKFDNDVNFIT